VNNNKKSIQIFEPLEQSIRYMDHYFYYKDEIKITLNQFLSSFKSKAEIEIALKQFYDSFDSYDELEIALKQCFNLKWRNF
jgi:hypothetical protein